MTAKHRRPGTPLYNGGSIHEGLHKADRKEQWTYKYNPRTKVFTFYSGDYSIDVNEEDIEAVSITGTETLPGTPTVQHHHNQRSLIGTALDLSM